jgi:SWI/SNF-related matrix-associated actin-dependent regulator of chromatin subfamily A member 5
LLKEGFLTWDRRDFQKIVQALETYPREMTVEIANHVGTKTPEEVEKYLDVFFKQMESLSDYEKIKRTLERAESMHSFKKQAPVLIRQKVNAYERPVEEMVINYA